MKPPIDGLPPAPSGAARGWPWRAPEDRAAPARVDDPPTITLVMPSFQQAAFLERAIRSVLLQDYPRLEFFVLDGGSTDGSREIIERYAPWIDYSRSAKDAGQSAAINEGMRRGTGAIANWLNSDDELAPGALWSVARAVKAHPDACAWAARGRTLSERGRLVYPQIPRGLDRASLADWGRAGQIFQPACFFTRAAFLAVGGLGEDYHYAMDLDLWLRLAALGRIVAVHETWASETAHSRTKSRAQRGRSLAEVHLVQLRSGFEELALRRMGEELQEREELLRRTLRQRLRDGANLLLRPTLERLGWGPR